MDPAADITALARTLSALQPDRLTRARLLGLISACIATDDQALVGDAFAAARQHAISRLETYELILQSYLFLGFPRMLNAAETLHSRWPESSDTQPPPVEPADPAAWMDRGERLCREVYAELYNPLKRKVESFAPDVFYWMVLEGYGKVLSRPGLTMAERELSIIAFLIIDHRPRQLHSHIRGALHCNTPTEHILAVVTDLTEAAPVGAASAQKICQKLGIAQS